MVFSNRPSVFTYEYQGVQQTIVFSEMNENGNYYAYSLLFNLITEVDGHSMEWIRLGSHKMG